MAYRFVNRGLGVNQKAGTQTIDITEIMNFDVEGQENYAKGQLAMEFDIMYSMPK